MIQALKMDASLFLRTEGDRQKTKDQQHVFFQSLWYSLQLEASKAQHAASEENTCERHRCTTNEVTDCVLCFLKNSQLSLKQLKSKVVINGKLVKIDPWKSAIFFLNAVQYNSFKKQTNETWPGPGPQCHNSQVISITLLITHCVEFSPLGF